MALLEKRDTSHVLLNSKKANVLMIIYSVCLCRKLWTWGNTYQVLNGTSWTLQPLVISVAIHSLIRTPTQNSYSHWHWNGSQHSTSIYLYYPVYYCPALLSSYFGYPRKDLIGLPWVSIYCHTVSKSGSDIQRRSRLIHFLVQLVEKTMLHI